MCNAEKLEGYWEEGYHYYLEIKNSHLTVRDYRRTVILETNIRYEADPSEDGSCFRIIPEEPAFRREEDGSMWFGISELVYRNGEIILKEYYRLDDVRETEYHLHKTEHGPFDHILIRDDEYLAGLQGVWKNHRRRERQNDLVIMGNEIRCFSETERFHVISYRTEQAKVYLVPEDLARDSFRGFEKVEVRKDLLMTFLQVSDMNMPAEVFVRENMLDRIEIPKEAMGSGAGGMINNSGMMKLPDQMHSGKKRLRFCPQCGRDNGKDPPAYCPECGQSLEP